MEAHYLFIYLFLVYLKLLPVPQTVYCWIRGWLVNDRQEKNVKGYGHGLIGDTILASVWEDWGKTSATKASLRSEAPCEYEAGMVTTWLYVCSHNCCMLE
jgi:hypothetical protein